jgi:superfamily II DNA/RNA helicase
MHAFLISIERRLAWVEREHSAADAPVDWTQPRLAFADEQDDWTPEDIAGLGAETGLTRDSELMWLRRLQSLAREAATIETKTETLARLLKRTREPVLVFSEFRDSVALLNARLAPCHPLALLHGGMSDDERTASIARFISGDARVLLATDAAGQGLNLHARCRWVVNLELPWTPSRLEQRAGRVDRIGQSRRVHITRCRR